MNEKKKCECDCNNAQCCKEKHVSVAQISVAVSLISIA